MLKQKFAGLCMIVGTISAAFYVDGDATAASLFVPLGLFLLFTKEEVM